MSTPTQVTPATLGARLERQRLLARIARLDRVLEVLRGRSRALDASTVERAGLHRAIDDFEAELAEATARLDAMLGGSSLTPVRGRPGRPASAPG